jgi:hypothetical protein
MYSNEPPVIRDIIEDTLKAFKYMAKTHFRKEKIKKIFDVDRKKIKS